MQGVQVQSLVRELSPACHRAWPPKQKKKKKHTSKTVIQNTQRTLFFLLDDFFIGVQLLYLHKEFLKLTKKTNSIFKWAKDLNRHLTKDNAQTENSHMKRWSTSYVMRKIQIKTTMRYHYTPIRITKTIWNTDTTKCWGRCAATEILTHCWWGYKMVQPLWKTVHWFLTNQIQQVCSLAFTQTN